MKPRLFQLALALGLITAVGPFAIDMYLPALPSIGASLNASPEAVQMSLMVFFITLGVCQLFYGPLSDMAGRKLPLYIGLTVFVIGSVGCALAPTIELLIAARVVQAVGGCCGMVVPRAIVRDLYTGPDATRLMSMLMLVMSVSPILAPVTGSAVIALVGWRGVFWAVSLAGLLGLGLAITQLKETRLPAARADFTWSGVFRGYGRLLVDLRFMGLVLAGAFSMAAFFVYLSNSSFVIIDHFGQTPTAYSLYFGVNAAAFFAAAQATGPLAARFGMRTVVRLAVIGFAVCVSAIAVITALGADNLHLIAAFLFVGFGFTGLVVPITGVLAIEEHGAIAGTASALMGGLQMAVGASAMAICSAFADGTPLPMLAGIAACAIVACAVVQATLYRPLVTAGDLAQ